MIKKLPGFRSARPLRKGLGVFLQVLLIGALALFRGGGCGGGNSSLAEGVLKITVRRPSEGRLIPQRTTQFHVQITRSGRVEINETLPLPPGGTVQKEYSLTIGIVQVTIEAQDSSGKVLASQSASAEIKEGKATSVTLDLQPSSGVLPQLTFTATPATVKTDEAVTLQWNAQDDDRLVHVKIDTNGDGVLDPVQAKNSVQVSFPDPGTYTLRGEAQDNDGLIARAETSVEVKPRLGQLEIIIK